MQLSSTQSFSTSHNIGESTQDQKVKKLKNTERVFQLLKCATAIIFSVGLVFLTSYNKNVFEWYTEFKTGLRIINLSSDQQNDKKSSKTSNPANILNKTDEIEKKEVIKSEPSIQKTDEIEKKEVAKSESSTQKNDENGDELTQKAEQQFDLGNFKKADELYTQAFKILPHPISLSLYEKAICVKFSLKESSHIQEANILLNEIKDQVLEFSISLVELSILIKFMGNEANEIQKLYDILIKKYSDNKSSIGLTNKHLLALEQLNFDNFGCNQSIEISGVQVPITIAYCHVFAQHQIASLNPMKQESKEKIENANKIVDKILECCSENIFVDFLLWMAAVKLKQYDDKKANSLYDKIIFQIWKIL